MRIPESTQAKIKQYDYNAGCEMSRPEKKSVHDIPCVFIEEVYCEINFFTSGINPLIGPKKFNKEFYGTGIV